MLQFYRLPGQLRLSNRTGGQTKLSAVVKSKSLVSSHKPLLREYKTDASDLKIGDVIEHKSMYPNTCCCKSVFRASSLTPLQFTQSLDKLVEITKIQHNFGAQRSASMQTEFKDVRTGNKGSDKFRVSEEVESTFLVPSCASTGLSTRFLTPHSCVCSHGAGLEGGGFRRSG